MKTHVDTAAAIRRRDTDLFMHITPAGQFCSWEPMSPRTAFFEEDDDRLTVILANHPDADVVRVTRVIDIVEVYHGGQLRVATPN